MTEEILDLCGMLERNISDEALAREGYFDILRYFGDLLSDAEVDNIKEIIAEELKHSELLSEMIRRRTRIFPEK